MKHIYLISGPPGAGKSTVALELSDSLPKSIHIECDKIYNMVKGGFVKPWQDGARALLEVMYDAFVAIATVYVNAGFTVVSDYVWNLDEVESIKRKFPSDFSIQLCFLLPSLKVNLQRDANREFVIGEDRVQKYHLEFEQIKKSYPKYFFDNTGISAQEIVRKLIDD